MPSEHPIPRIVTHVEISVANGAERHQVSYRDPRKITKVLNYLRRMEAWDIPEQNPLTLDGPRYSIDLHLSDGTKKTYEQVGSECFKENQRPWKKISKAYALQLPLILAAIPSDAI